MMWLINGEGEGLDGTGESGVLTADAADILSEMRSLRVEMLQNNKRFAQLEKRLRALLTETPDA